MAKEIYTSKQEIEQMMDKKSRRKEKRKAALSEKLKMYDMIIANLIAGKSIIMPNEKLGNSNIKIGFSNISSDSQVTKYFMIRQFPDFLQTGFIDYIRANCIKPGVKINFSMYGEPYKINWASPEMRNKLSIWRKYAQENSGDVGVFEYRDKRNESLAARRIINSTKYLNDAELNQKRSLIKAVFIISISASRDEASIINMLESIKTFKDICATMEIKVRELRINMLDWLKTLETFSLQDEGKIKERLSYKVITDDNLAMFNSYRQGRVGVDGVLLGMDVESCGPVLRKIKADPDAAENWVVAGGTGSGKSYWIKSLVGYLIAAGFVVTVMDYEGDEYTNLAGYIAAGNKDDVKVISMGKRSTMYFDPCEIARLTGDEEVDCELKETAVSYILAIFRVIICGVSGKMSQWESSVVSKAVERMYDSAGVTDDRSTWARSKDLRLVDVYQEIKMMVESKELVDEESDNSRHKAAIKIANAASIYFEDGGSKSGTFKNPLSVEEVYSAKFIVFSFGMRGASNSTSDETTLALKQLSVALVSTQISNYCKYVKKCFNVKIWEEYQRWGQAEGSAEIITDAMTGGRKRGDVNFIITNDLANLLDEENPINNKLRQNIQNYAIGKIPAKGTREKFCKAFELNDCIDALDKIAKSKSGDSGKNDLATSRYRFAFCVIMDDGKKAIVKSLMPPALMRSDLYKTGVKVEE